MSSYFNKPLTENEKLMLKAKSELMSLRENKAAKKFIQRGEIKRNEKKHKA